MAVRWTEASAGVWACDYVGDSKHKHGRAAVSRYSAGEWLVFYRGHCITNTAPDEATARTLAVRYVVGCLKLKEKPT